ncbi:MMPL family transporter [Cellulosimicrobium marinum]|uniref:MMPL family transporter n=1 Tax=Cellulosimicrobium marinum TaxID=1638992 RepID=UPI001E3FB984|nr:MMPL family transporter [Cellulosimicrobium marinum]MCB7135592.1 MMPL family transporter [Cellulosimicrobium marinum]
MAELLYRLGRGAARHVRAVVAAWLALLVVAGVGFAVAGGTLTDSFSIPGTPTEEVTDRVADELPEAAGGTGTVVLTTTGDEAFTADQESALADVFADVEAIDGVETVVDPFASEADRADQAAQLDAAQDEIATGREQIEAGQQQLDDARAQLEQGQAQLDAARAQAEAAGQADAVAPQLDAQQQQIDAGLAELDTQQETLDANAAELEAGVAELEQGQALLDLASEIRVVSEDADAAVATVVFTEDQFTVSQDTRDAVIDTLTEGVAAIDGVEVDLGSDISMEAPSIIGPGEIVGLVVAGVVLVVMLGTFIGAGLPLVTALVGVGVAALGALAFSGVVEMSSVTPVLGLMLGLAVGIDYALFIVNRHRRQLKEGYDVEESIGLANGTSGNAVVFAGSTVVIALLALNVTGIPFLGLMGTVGAASVAIAVLVAVTLTPALLSAIGPRILNRKERAALEPVHGAHAAPSTATTGTDGKPVRPMSTLVAVGRVVLGVAVLGVVAIPATDLRINLPDGSSEPHDSTAYQAYSTVAEEFGPGVNGPLLVVADVPEPVAEEDLVAVQLGIGEQLAAQDDVVAVAPAGASEDGTVLAFQVVPAEGPTSESTEELVHHLRDLTPLTVDAAGGEVELGVAGAASGNIDISEKLSAALPVYLAVVIGLSLIILVVVFRSLLVPLVATAGFVLSYYAALGGVVAIYQWGWLAPVFGVEQPGPVLNFLPTILVGVLFGLAMDYMLFLGTGMREAYAHGAPARLAVVQGFRAGRSVVTAAAIIMISVFGGFIFAHDAMIRPIGFALAFGVLVDAFVVRMLVVPAVMHLLGGAAWWLPKWLDRILPDVDVEGAALERRHPHVEGSEEPAVAAGEEAVKESR